MVNVTIRKLNKEDVPQLFILIKELAEYEKSAERVTINPSTLEADGFDVDNPAFHCVVAENTDNGKLIGYAFFYIIYSSWVGKSVFMEDLYVQAPYRQKGVGKQLITDVAKVAREIGGNLDFPVLPWNPACGFYKHLGATDITETEKWHFYRFNPKTLKTKFN